MRHDKSMPLSFHAYGIAVDINPKDNRAIYTKKKIEPWTTEWFNKWPNGIPQSIVRAFKAEGWSWGGDWSGYIDPMHFEYVKRR
jgi:hypothetical protein